MPQVNLKYGRKATRINHSYITRAAYRKDLAHIKCNSFRNLHLYLLIMALNLGTRKVEQDSDGRKWGMRGRTIADTLF